jgi:Fe2+ or Zn2+ uptake regulation protein
MGRLTEDARGRIKAAGLRVTQPRLALLRLLESSSGPVSHADAVRALGELGGDPATAYRNLVKLVEVGLAQVASTVGGVTHFEQARPHGRHHPHFRCAGCGIVSCLPGTQVAPPTGPWNAAVAEAEVTFVGRCPRCRGGAAASAR